LARRADGCAHVEWIVARWVSYLCTLLISGACAVRFALVPRSDADHSTQHELHRDAARLALGAALALIPASLLRLADQVMSLRSPGDPIMAGVSTLLTSTTWGTGFLWQGAALLVSLIGLALATRFGSTVGWWLLATIGAIGLSVTPAMQGHAIGSDESTMLAVGADIVHVIGASVWLGALGVIAWLGTAQPTADGVISANRTAHRDARLRLLVPLVPPIALTGAVMLVGSGVLTSVLHLRAVSDLWQDGWGRYVLAKSIIVAAIVALGALNWRRLGPRLSRETGTAVLRKSLLTELALALVVLLITAVLVVTPLPGE
jgi:putative copper export protein